MSKICVTRNAAFFNTANRLGIPANNLEVIVHNYMNNVKAEFPSDDYIRSKFYLKPFITTSQNVIDGWKKYYSSPIVLSRDNERKVIGDAITFFGNNNVLVYENPKGEKVLVVASPLYKKDNVNDKVPEGYVSASLFDEDAYLYDLKTYDKHQKQFNNFKDAENEYNKLSIRYPGRVRLVRDRNNLRKWIVDVARPLTTDESFRLYIPADSRQEELDYYNSLSEDEILSQQALAEQERKEYKDEDMEAMLLQKKNLIDELEKLKTINRPLSGAGSIKKMKEALKRTGVSPLIYNTIIKAIELDNSLAALKPYDIFQVISKQQSSDFADLYNQYLQQPINRELEKHLAEFLERYHIDINVGNAVERFGVAGAYDIINKVIYLANEQDRNSITFAEEFAHAFVELMGAKVSNKPENADYTFLYNSVETTKIYQQVYEEYKDTYVKDGKPDIQKIKKEAIGQALAVAVKNKWENRDINKQEESGFWAKLKQWFNNILNSFKNVEYINFESLINTIAEEIVLGQHQRLEKVDSSNYSILNYAETIANQNKKDGGKALSFMTFFCEEMGNIITGSLSYRYQGTLYRSSLDALHDIDMLVPPTAHNIGLESPMVKSLIRRNKYGTTILLDYLASTEYFKKVKEQYPKIKFLAAYSKSGIAVNAVYSEDESLSERFGNMSGSYASRLDKFTEEERDQIYLFDFFLNEDPLPYVTEEQNRLKLDLYSNSFKEKLKMGRAKDIYDYQSYKLFEEFKGLHSPYDEEMMFQKPKGGFIWNAEQSAAIKEVSDFINRRLRGQESQPFYTLQGKAGTGKTTIINEILSNIQFNTARFQRPIVGIGALSHKAKEVLTGKLSKEAKQNFTIKSKSIAGLLGIKPRIIYDENTKEAVEVFQVDENDYTRRSVFHEASVIFIDEASMVNESILETIKKDIGNRNVAVIFIGDKGQLPPIRSAQDPYYKGKHLDTDAPSPIFTDKAIPKSVLSVRVRQGESSPVLDYADNFWNFATGNSNRYPIDKATGAKTKITNEGALVIQSQNTDLTQQLLPLFERAKAEKDPNVVKIVAYTNARVDEYNRRLHYSLHPEAASNNDMNFYEGDLIIFNDSFALSPIEQIENSSEGIITGILREDEYKHNDVTSPVKMRSIIVKLQSGKEVTIPIVEKSEANLNVHRLNLEKLKETALKAQKGTYEFKKAWKDFYEYRDKFANLGYGYAITSHKSQGSTYEVVAVDSANIEGVKPISYKTKAHSIYTALTRAANVTIVNSSTSTDNAPNEEISDINERIKSVKRGEKPVKTEQQKQREEDVKKENNNPPVSEEETIDNRRNAVIDLGGEQLDITYTFYDTEAVDRLASSDSKGNISLYKLRGKNSKEKVDFFFDYILGRSDKKHSALKTEIFKELAKLGYTEDFLRKLITNSKEAYTFLLLHENQHIINKDHVTVALAKERGEETLERVRYKVEYKATYNAIKQLILSKQMEDPESKLKKSNAYKVLNEIKKFNTEHLTFDEDSHIYYIDGVPVDTSVTSVLHGQINEDSQYLKVSSAIGTTHDTIARDYLGSPKVVKTDYPNMSKEDVENFHKELDKLVRHLDSRFGRGQYDIVTDESMLRMVGRININGQYKTIAGTMDMLVIDRNGNFHIFDFKTNRANNHTEFTAENAMIYPKQVEMYKQMLEHNNGKVESVNLIQFNILYDTPKGKGQYETGEVEYTVSNGQVIATYGRDTVPIQNMSLAQGLGFHRIYTPGTLYKVHDNVHATLTEGEKILPYKEEVPNNLKDSLDKVESQSGQIVYFDDINELYDTMFADSDAFVGEIQDSPYKKEGNKFVLKADTTTKIYLKATVERGLTDRARSQFSKEDLDYLQDSDAGRDETKYFNVGYESGGTEVMAVTNRELYDLGFTPKTIMFVRENYTKEVEGRYLSQFKNTSTILVFANDTKAIDYLKSNGYKYRIYGIKGSVPQVNYLDATYEQVMSLLNKNPKEITIDMLESVIRRYKEGEIVLDDSEKETLNNIYKKLLVGQTPTKSTIANTSVYKVEKIDNTNDLYTGAVKITLDVNAPRYGRKEALNKILDTLDVSNIVYLDGTIGPDFFATIAWMRQAGLNQSGNYRRVRISQDETLINSAKQYGLIYNEQTGEVYIPSFIVGLTEQELRTIRQNDVLLNSDMFTPSELRGLSKSAVFKVSEYITMLTTQPEANEILLGEDFQNYDFVGKDRIEVISVVGLNRLFNIVKERFFNTEDERTEDWDFDTIDKADIIYNNFEAFMDLGYDALIGMEGVSKYNQTDVATELDDVIDDQTAQEIQEIYGNSIEHWQVGFRQVSAFSSLSQMIKRTFEKMYVLDSDGNQIIDEFGFAKTLSPQEAVAKVLKWVQYAESVQDMIDKIKLHQSTNPWVQQIIDKLESNDDEFKSQFFSNFKKYFQKYSILYKDNTSDKVLMKMINESSYSDTIMGELKGKVASYAMGNYNLKNVDGTVNTEALNRLKKIHESLEGKEDKDVSGLRLLEEAYKILDIPTPEFLEFSNNIGKGQFLTAISKLGFLIKRFDENLDNKDFDPLKGGEYKYLISISANILGEQLEAVSYEAGKLYYSYVTPSYLNKLIGKLQGNVKDYTDFIEEEYGKYPQFYKNGKYRSFWLDRIVNDKNVREHLDHKASLHYLGTNYVNKTPAQYIASIMQEFFYDDKNKAWAWYRIPMMSNKPSEEYIKFMRIHLGFKEAITGHLLDILALEIDRMSAVRERKSINKDFKIKNFDTKGASFVFLDYLNAELDNNTELGVLIKNKVNGLKLNPTEEVRFLELAEQAIQAGMDAQYQKEKQYWKEEGFITETENGIVVNGVDLGNTQQDIENSLQEFFWNDTLASINILQLTITDPAYYSNAEDLQKRLAQLHAPGMRANLEAKDMNGNPYTDGKFRSIIIKDFEIASEVIPNLQTLREELIAKEKDPVKKALIRNQFDSIIDAFKKVNVADAQAYCSPTSYRKKMGIFGKWNAEQERVYQEIRKGNVSPENLSVLWQPLKPFVYSQTEKPGYSSVFDKLKVGYQFKNSEYLLIIADALLRAGNKPNKLSAIFDIMEESAHDNPRTGNDQSKGIDTIQFHSAVKAGLSGVIDINKLNSVEAVKAELRSKIYDGNDYSKDYVHTLPMEDFSLQQEVPGHFKGQQQAGSQNRILIVADFPEVDENGNAITIKVDGEVITVKEAKERYYKAVADNINQSYQELVRRFKLDNLNYKQQNIAISRILQDAILKDGRMGSDLLWACSVNKFGKFNIPLSDPTQSDRIQQLLNSIIKNNINKQEIAGGPVVQVSNYGTADELHIRYQNENGEVLMTEEEYNMEESPSGFIPKDGTKTFAEYLKKHQKSVAYFECYVPIYDDNIVRDFSRPDGTIDVEAMERNNPDLLKMIGYRIPTEAKYSMVPIKIKGFLPPNAGEGIMLPKEITTLSGSDFDIDKLYVMRYMFDRTESFDREAFIDKIVSNNDTINPNAINNILNKILAGESFEEGTLEMMIYDYYEDNKHRFTTVEYTKPISGKHANNNYVISTQFAVLTHENSMEQLFTPGNFDVPKKLGYLMDVIKSVKKRADFNPEEFDIESEYKALSDLSIDELKDRSMTDKNLIYSSVHVQFHKQNMTAGKLIGVFATGNVSHAFMSLQDCYLNIPVEYGFVINGKSIVGKTKIDPAYDESGNRVSSNLAAFLAASVDAVKDPVLNLVNVNINTANILMTLSRLGFDTETICLLLSQPVIDKVLNRLTLDSRNNYIGDVIDNMKKQLQDRLKIEIPANFNFTKEFFIQNLLTDNEVNDLYILDLMEKVLSLSQTFKNITHMTKYNSITSAVGPFASTTENKRIQMQDFYNDDLVTESVIKAVNNPILKAFRDNAYSLEQALLGNNIIQASPLFKGALRQLKDNIGYMTDSISNEFSNFFITYLVNMNDGIYDMSFEHRKEVLMDFPNKLLKTKEQYPDNLLLQNIKYVTDNDGYASLELRTRGLSSEQEQDIKSSWSKLYKEDPELALQILEYNVFKGTFGFNPKTFTKLVPNTLKKGLPKYIERLSVRNIPVLSDSQIDNIIIQFILNNGFLPAGTHDIKDFDVMSKTEEGLMIKNKNKNKKVRREGVGNIVIDNVSRTAYFEKVGTLTKVTFVDSLGGNKKAVEFNPNERFPKSIYGDSNDVTPQGDPQESATKKDLSVREKQGILLSLLYNEQELQRVSQYNLSQDEVRRQFILSMQTRYSKAIGREVNFKERAFFWNNVSSLQDIINIMAGTDSSNYIKLIGDINVTLQNLNLCS